MATVVDTWGRITNVNKRTLLLIGMFLSIVTGVGLLLFGVRKPVALIVDGETRYIASSAFTVGELLRSANIHPNEQDKLTPEADTWLKPNLVISLDRAVLISLWVDDDFHTLVSAERLPANLLAEAGVSLFPGDRLLVDGMFVEPDETLSARPHSLQVLRASGLDIRDQGQPRRVDGVFATIGQALWEADVYLTSGDLPSLSLNSVISPSLKIDISRSRQVELQMQQDTHVFQTTASTVGEALTAAGVIPQLLDYSIPDFSEPLPENGEIRLVRVSESIQIDQTPVPFQTEYRPVAELALDTQQIIQTGEYGLEAQRVRVRYEDGIEAGRIVEAQWLAREPEARIVGYGTQVVKMTTNTPDGQIAYWRALQMYATSYSPCRLGVPNYCNDVTASGAKLQKGVAAVTRPLYASIGGARVYVSGYGTAVIADIGGGVGGGNWIDLGYSDKDFVQWNKTVTVYFLWPPPENISWVLP